MGSKTWQATGLLSMAAAVLCTTPVSAQQQDTDLLRFGVYATDKPSTMRRKFAPVTKALGDQLSKLRGAPTEVRLRVFMGYEEGLDALVRGKVDLVRFGAASYVLAKSRNPKVALLAMENKKGKRAFKGYIVVRSDSEIHGIAQLRGKSFAFGNENSTIGRYFAQARLLDSGLNARSIARFEFLGRHDKVFRAVQLREFEAGALKSGTYKKLNKRKQLRVLDSFDVPTKPWVGRAGLSLAMRESISKALIALDNKAALKALKVQGFFAATEKDYAEVRRCMQQALQFRSAVARPGKD